MSAAVPAVAQTPAAAQTPATAQTAEVEQLVAEGIELRVQGLDAQALERFRKAAALSPDSRRIRGHLALALHAQGHWLESERAMLEVLSAPADEWVLRHAVELRESLESVQKHLAWLDVEAPGPGEVWVDQRFVGNLPIPGPVRVVAQRSTISLHFPDRPTLQKTIELSSGQHIRFTLLEPPAAVPATQLVPDRSLPRRTPTERTTAPGRSARTTAVGAALLGVGVAGFAAGISLGIHAIILRQQRDDACKPDGCNPNAIALDARGRQTEQQSNVFLAVGVAGLAIGTAILW